MRRRDHQRARVYAWEDTHVAPADPGRLPFAQASGMVRAIWTERGLRYPPRVEPLPASSRCLGDATRLAIRLGDPFPSWCLLHELAHSLTCTHDGDSDGHGTRFMGIYMRLLDAYLRLDLNVLAASASAAGIRFDLDATPIFADPA
jgi:hypothetical protein